MNYYSVRIAVIGIVDDGVIPDDGYTQDIQVHVVRAEGFDEAFDKALEIGRSQERCYQNEDGHSVIWRFKEIEYVRNLGQQVVGVEISTRFESYFPIKALGANSRFCPEESNPITDG
ncbi:MAG: DUF4288 domain-containing protein [Desulfobacteraceae bacterium]|nr:DUF4288 domain-containing protein [Desulfobacteraceae bacterium]